MIELDVDFPRIQKYFRCAMVFNSQIHYYAIALRFDNKMSRLLKVYHKKKMPRLKTRHKTYELQALAIFFEKKKPKMNFTNRIHIEYRQNYQKL